MVPWKPYLVVSRDYEEARVVIQDLIDWFNTLDIKVEALSDIEKIFGVWKRQADFHLLNHFLILAKQHISVSYTHLTLPTICSV